MDTCIYDTVPIPGKVWWMYRTSTDLAASVPDFSLFVRLLREPNSNNTYRLSLLAFTTVSTI